MSSFGSSTTTQQQNNSTQNGTNTPTEAANVTNFRNSLYPQINSLIANAGKPVYGAAQEAQFGNNLNKTTNANLNSLTSTLAARTGSVNSGAYAGGVQNLLNQRQAAQSGYAMQVPMLNEQARVQQQQAALGLATNFAGRAPVGNTTSGNTSGSNTSTVTQNPSVFSDIMNVASAGAGIAGAAFGMPGLGGMMGGMGGMNNQLQSGLNASGYFAPSSGMSQGFQPMPVGGGFNDIPAYF